VLDEVGAFGERKKKNFLIWLYLLSGNGGV
jgi:hypothetical protein